MQEASYCFKKLGSNGYFSLLGIYKKKYHKLDGFTAEIYNFTLLDLPSPRSKCQQGWFLLKAMTENLFYVFCPASDALLAVCGIPCSVETLP